MSSKLSGAARRAAKRIRFALQSGDFAGAAEIVHRRAGLALNVANQIAAGELPTRIHEPSEQLRKMISAATAGVEVNVHAVASDLRGSITEVQSHCSGLVSRAYQLTRKPSA